ncbi:MAG: hypothetical protein JRG93_18780, partial [Deltaproteobacteria bacterium]|nr:hypothetical protein [Deltaproteobacteria bacterium]
MGKFSRTTSLMRASWDVLKQDKELLLFPLLSGICCVLVLASFAGPILAMTDWQAASEAVTAQGLLGSDGHLTATQAWHMLTLFLFYCTNYFVIIFFNAGLIACAQIRMEGGDPTVSDGLRAAWARLPAIAGWAVLAGTVGMLLRLIEQRSNLVGKIVVGLLGMAWSLTSFLVIPILVIDNESPVSALRRSAAMLKKTWGEQLIGNFSFGLIFMLLSLPGILVLVVGVTAQSVTLIVFAVLYFVGIALAQSALQGIFQAALYLYMR